VTEQPNHLAPPDQLVATAIQATGLDDFGADTWQEGLDRLVADLDEHGRLHELGVAIVEGEIVDYLSNRLGIIEWRKTHPAVAEGRIDRPLVIVGQPRTGTTILYDLLALDPAHRAPLAWEVDRPLPPPRTETLVAMKYLSRFLSSESRSPTTDSARPYDGAVSMMRPPSSGKVRSVSRSGGISSGLGF